MNFVKHSLLGLLYGVFRFDWVIIISIGLLALLIGFPKESNGVLRLALEPVFASRFEEKERSILQTIQSAASHDYQKQLKGYKQLSEMQPDNESYKLNVNKLTKLIEQERLAKIKAQRAAEAKSEKKKLARLKAQRAAEVRRKKEARRKALRDAELKKQRVARKLGSFKKSLRQSKWSGDLFTIKRKQKYLTDFNVTLRCNKTLTCTFSAAANSTSMDKGTWSPFDLLNPGKKVTLTPSFSSKGKLILNVSKMPTVTRLANNSSWNSNGKWVGELKGDKMLILWHGNDVLELKRGSY